MRRLKVRKEYNGEELTAILRWLSESLDTPDCNASEFRVVAHRENPSSTHWIIESESAEMRNRLFIKRHRSTILYEQERNALSNLSAYSSPQEPYAVPELRAASDKLNCIALSWIEGESIGLAMRNSVSRFAKLRTRQRGVELATLTGKWLQHLNRRTATESRTLPRAELLDRFVELISLICASKRGLIRRSHQSRLHDYFDLCLRHSEPETTCLVHKDFWFDHIWTSGAQLIVLDFGRAHFGPAGRDVNQFYCRLSDLGVFNPAVSKSSCGHLQKAYLSGYGSIDLENYNNRMWRMLTRAEQLAGLAELANGATPQRVGPIARMNVLTRQLFTEMN